VVVYAEEYTIVVVFDNFSRADFSSKTRFNGFSGFDGRDIR